jgi:large subunit ribosomal protein L31e
MAEEKIILEREYIVPLRTGWIKVPYYRRTKRALKELKEFIAKHMKVTNRDIRKVKVDKWLNMELWKRGIRKPHSKIKVKAKKLENGNVLVELSEMLEVLKYKKQRETRAKEESEKIKKEKADKKKQEEEKRKAAEEKAKEQKEESKEVQSKEEKADETAEAKKKEVVKEKKESMIEAGLKESEAKHKQLKHESKQKQPKEKMIQRKALKK